MSPEDVLESSAADCSQDGTPTSPQSHPRLSDRFTGLLAYQLTSGLPAARRARACSSHTVRAGELAKGGPETCATLPGEVSATSGYLQEAPHPSPCHHPQPGRIPAPLNSSLVSYLGSALLLSSPFSPEP